MIKVSKLLDNEEKSKISVSILRKLPEWFGMEEGIMDCATGSKESDFYVAYEDSTPIGFISIKSNNLYTSEIFFMGVLKEYHNKGIGKQLIAAAEEDLTRKNIKFFMVKTLGESHPDKNYKCTREFYRRVGFCPLEEIKEIWGKENPCLILVKAI